MFVHNFKYSLALLLKNRQLVFWTIAFPLIMAVLFNMAFSDIENEEAFDAIHIAVVDDKDFHSSSIFKTALEELSSGDDKIFEIVYTDKTKAQELLENNEITGYLSFSGDDVKVTINSNGTSETILCYIIDEIKSDIAVITEIGTEAVKNEIMAGNTDIDYEKYYKDASDLVTNSEVNLKDTSNHHLSYVMIEYYSLIAMTCLYSGLFSMTLVNYKLANVSAVGKRTAVSPAKKGGMLLGSLAAGFVVQLAGLLLLFLLMIFVIGADFGTNLAMILTLSVFGSLAGLTMGIAVAVLIKAGENAKLTALIGITMAGSFLSGMMGITMKNVIDKNVPILNKINPVAMITDGFYALYYYDTPERFYIDLISLAVFSAVMLMISWGGLRRQRYDSL